MSTQGEAAPTSDEPTTTGRRRPTLSVYVVTAIDVLVLGLAGGRVAFSEPIPGPRELHITVIVSLAVATLYALIMQAVERYHGKRSREIAEIREICAGMAGVVRSNSRSMGDLEQLLLTNLEQLSANTGDLAAGVGRRAAQQEQFVERICSTLGDIQEAVERRIDSQTAEHDRSIYMQGYTAGITQQN